MKKAVSVATFSERFKFAAVTARGLCYSFKLISISAIVTDADFVNCVLRATARISCGNSLRSSVCLCHDPVAGTEIETLSAFLYETQRNATP